MKGPKKKALQSAWRSLARSRMRDMLRDASGGYVSVDPPDTRRLPDALASGYVIIRLNSKHKKKRKTTIAVSKRLARAILSWRDAHKAEREDEYRPKGPVKKTGIDSTESK